MEFIIVVLSSSTSSSSSSSSISSSSFSFVFWEIILFSFFGDFFLVFKEGDFFDVDFSGVFGFISGNLFVVFSLCTFSFILSNNDIFLLLFLEPYFGKL